MALNSQDQAELRRIQEIIEELRRMRRRYDTSTRANAHYSGAVSSLLSVQKILRASKLVGTGRMGAALAAATRPSR